MRRRINTEGKAKVVCLNLFNSMPHEPFRTKDDFKNRILVYRILAEMDVLQNIFRQEYQT